MIEEALTEALVIYYAKQLAQAWVDHDDSTVRRVREYILGNYGDIAVQSLGNIAVMLIANRQIMPKNGQQE